MLIYADGYCMNRVLSISIMMLCIVSMCIVAVGVQAQEVKRADVPEKYRWNLTDLYPSIDAWKAEKGNITPQVDGVAQYQGHLGESADALFTALSAYFSADKTLNRLNLYASLLSDEDIGIAENLAWKQEIANLFTVFNEKSAYIEPELIAIAPETIAEYRQEKPALEEFSMFIDDAQRRRAHTLSEGEEKILASAGSLTDMPENVYNIFNDSEMPFPQVKLANGETIDLGVPAYIKYRSSNVREDRQTVMLKLFEQYGKFKETLGANLVANLKKDYFYAKNRKYTSCVESSLDQDNVPTSLYENLIAQIHNSLPTLHRFLDLKKRMLGVDQLHYYDLYASIVKDVEVTYNIDDGQQLLLKTLEPLGKEYVETVKTGFENRWVDYMPTPNKASGAYENAAYEVHPYLLMNWTDDYDSLTTLTHEAGHALHSYFTNKTQPYAKSNYPIFVAEIASTLNEDLLIRYLIDHTEDQTAKLAILGNYLENLRTTIFRQVQFAEFEWEIHKKIEAGEALTGESLSQLYYNIVKTYYGQDAGHCVVDPEIAYEWAYIPHFYYNFYVYKYATSLIYATALTEKIVQQGQPAVDNYFKLLNGGASKYPADLVKDAGIDPFSSEAFELTMKRMNTIMDEIEAILAKK